MWILGLEAGAALFLLVFVVWWTMFAGRKPEQPVQPHRAKRPPDHDAGQPRSAPPPAPGESDTPAS